MPKIRFAGLPAELRAHILQRIEQREISLNDLFALQQWVASEPEAPESDWWKDFGSFKLCGTGEFPKTVLTKKMKPFGTEIQ